MDFITNVNEYLESNGGRLHEKKGLYTYEQDIAERKAFLSKKKLKYIAKYRLDHDLKTLKFSEMLMESGSGISSGGMGMDEGISPGFGFKAETYSSGPGGRSGSIEEQSNLFGKEYEYDFDYGKIRKDLEAMADKYGFKFEYHITPANL